MVCSHLILHYEHWTASRDTVRIHLGRILSYNAAWCKIPVSCKSFRVTELCKFSPLGWLFNLEKLLWKITTVSPNFGLLNLGKIEDWATIWAILTRTHLVTLSPILYSCQILGAKFGITIRKPIFMYCQGRNPLDKRLSAKTEDNATPKCVRRLFQRSLTSKNK
jgi:hypothetical protein